MTEKELYDELSKAGHKWQVEGSFINLIGHPDMAIVFYHMGIFQGRAEVRTRSGNQLVCGTIRDKPSQILSDIKMVISAAQPRPNPMGFAGS